MTDRARELMIAAQISEFCKANNIHPKDASVAMLINAGGIIGLAADDEGDLLDGIKLANDALRAWAVKGWEHKRRVRGHD